MNDSWQNTRRLHRQKPEDLEKEIEKLVQIYARGRIILQGVPSDGTNLNQKPEEISATRESGIIHERE